MTGPHLTRWRHYEVLQFGECTVSDTPAHCDIGIVETGRSRVFAGYFFRIRLADGEEIIAEDGGSMIAALWHLARSLSARGLHLQCAGMSGKWHESGLSQNTGWGYYGPEQQRMHMLDDMPEDGADEILGRAIREAVDGMKVKLA